MSHSPPGHSFHPPLLHRALYYVFCLHFVASGMIIGCLWMSCAPPHPNHIANNHLSWSIYDWSSWRVRANRPCRRNKWTRNGFIRNGLGSSPGTPWAPEICGCRWDLAPQRIFWRTLGTMWICWTQWVDSNIDYVVAQTPIDHRVWHDGTYQTWSALTESYRLW